MATLQERLQNHSEQMQDKLPPEAPEIMEKAKNELRNSGLLDKALGTGDRAPSFELPNHEGVSVRSEDLLAEGPLVLMFYRGVW